MDLASQIAVSCLDQRFLNDAHEIASQSGLTLLTSEKPETTHLNFLLQFESDNNNDYRLELRECASNHKPVYVDFESDALEYRSQFGGGRKQAIARAVGVKSGKMLTVLDATAGLGKDAFVLASLGCRVTMSERNPVAAALLADGLRRFKKSNSDVAGRLLFIRNDSKQLLQQNAGTFDVIYLDPMYPARSKSALVKKELRMLRQLVGDDLDAAVLLQAALQNAAQRVVVKRPVNATGVSPAIRPSHIIKSRNTRYDVYCKP